MASSRPSSGTSSGSSSRSTGRSPDGQELEGLLEAVVVVGERTGDDELVEQDAVGVEARRLDAGAHEHERAAADELGQPRLHRLGLAGALEHHVDGPVHHQARLGDARHHEVGGVHARGGADGGGQRLAVGSPARRSATSSTPERPEGGDR